MPRRRSHERRRPPELIWTPTHGGFTISSGEKSPICIKVTDLVTPDTSLDWTHERTRGDIIMKMSAAPANPPLGWVSGLVLPDVVYGNHETGTLYGNGHNSDRMPPLVGDHDGSDDFPLATSFCAPPGVTQFVRPIDDKAHRRWSARQ